MPLSQKLIQDWLPSLFLCAACSLPSKHTICDCCQRTLYRNESILPSKLNSVEGFAPLLYAFESSQKLIRKWKEHQGSQIARTLFQMPMGLKHSLMELHFFAIVPIPQSQKRSYRRGHESALEVAHFFSQCLDRPVLHLLQLNQDTPKRQTGMNRFDREFSANPFQISSNFSWTSPLFQQLETQVLRGSEIRILLIDDLITSGSTISKATYTLKDFLPRSKIWAGSLGYRPKLNRVEVH